MLDESVVGVAGEVPDVLQVTGDQVVQPHHPMSLGQKPVREVGTQKSSPSRDD
jgi:hypothetical protein